MHRLQLCCLPAALLVPVLAGCDDGRTTRFPVSGKIMIDGEPLTAGFIQVVPQGDRAASGKIESDGSFRLTTYEEGDGCVAGTHQVAIIASESQGANATKWYAPKKYADSSTSELTIEVTGPRGDVKIELTWDGKAPFVEKFEDEGTGVPQG